MMGRKKFKKKGQDLVYTSINREFYSDCKTSSDLKLSRLGRWKPVFKMNLLKDKPPY